MLVPIDSIRIDGGTQPRAITDQATINDYRDALQAGATFPPVVVFHDGQDYWLADGFHRHAAHIMRRLPDIDADIRQGTRRDAVLYSVGANSSHGLRRTNEDKRRAVLTLLGDEEWVKWSDNQIARRAHVSPTTVGSLRRSLSNLDSEAGATGDSAVEPQEERTYTTKHGAIATMQVSNIGRPANDNRPVQATRTIEPPDSAPVAIGGATLYLADCRAVLPALGDVSHVICDPPYEEQAHKAQIRTHADIKSGERSRLAFEPITEDLRRFVASEANRLADGWFLAFCQFEAIGRWQQEILSAGAKYRSVGVWVKPDSSPQFNGNKPAVSAEPFVLGWCGDGDSKWNNGGMRGVYTHNVNAGRHGGHQTEKPLPLLRALLLEFTNPGDTILDPFMGIGSLGVACMELGRRYIGIEMDARYFDVACERMRAVGMAATQVA